MNVKQHNYEVASEDWSIAMRCPTLDIAIATAHSLKSEFGDTFIVRTVDTEQDLFRTEE